MSRPDCVFCDIISGLAPADDFRMCGVDTLAFTPLGPVAPGHTVVVPREHVADACEDPMATAQTMRWAAIVAKEFLAANIITSIGADATQTIAHLHLHVVPRRPGDGLVLPWTGQVRGDGVQERFRPQRTLPFRAQPQHDFVTKADITEGLRRASEERDRGDADAAARILAELYRLTVGTHGIGSPRLAPIDDMIASLESVRGDCDE